MGANLKSAAGEPAETLVAAAERLGALGRVTRRSSLYSTAPVGFAEQPRFTNAVVALETALEPPELLRELLGIEKEFGRDRAKSFANGPRTLDLDLLLVGGVRLETAELVLPHPRLAGRAFVLVPLAEIAPEVRVPGLDASVAELLERLRGGDPEDVRQVERTACAAWQPGRIVE
jgi:2-amino-4-hydroxy-6-hydroxymethyldihydropteridine diphosphokinase